MTEQPEELELADVYADLGGIAEICDALGVSIYQMRRWIERRDTTNCPLPVRPLKQGNVYSINAWRGWFALWRITRGSETWNRKQKPLFSSLDDE